MNALIPILRRSGLVRRPDRDFFHWFFEDFGLLSLLSEETTFMPAFDVSETEKDLNVCQVETWHRFFTSSKPTKKIPYCLDSTGVQHP